jgi:hypothetical protein
MSTLMIRLPETQHQSLKAFARSRGISLNELVEEWATVAWGTEVCRKSVPIARDSWSTAIRSGAPRQAR